jgi:hypothetical protein
MTQRIGVFFQSMSPVSLRRIAAAAALLAMIGGWYFFRPERAFIDRRVDEPAPATVERVLLTGLFEPRAHEGRGRVDVLDLGTGQRVLRFSDFETSDGPDLQVYLLGAADAANTDDVDRAGFVTLGALKGNVGPQNYAIPADTDLKKYRAVSVWCRRFGVNFTTATLGRPPSDGS